MGRTLTNIQMTLTVLSRYFVPIQSTQNNFLSDWDFINCIVGCNYNFVNNKSSSMHLFRKSIVCLYNSTEISFRRLWDVVCALCSPDLFLSPNCFYESHSNPVELIFPFLEYSICYSWYLVDLLESLDCNESRIFFAHLETQSGSKAQNLCVLISWIQSKNWFRALQAKKGKTSKG